MAAKKKWPSIRDGKPATSTPVKYYPGLGYAPIRKAKKRKKSKNSKLKIA
jgi:hypothetical protein|tara:strand:- start:316 stop:465 length:150 start_codon:yes stop_codon:yes gene_type:complete